LVISLLEKEIKTRTGVLLSYLNPNDFVSKIKTPVFTIVGNQDELVD